MLTYPVRIIQRQQQYVPVIVATLQNVDGSRGCLLQYVCTGQGLARARVVSLSTAGYGHGVFDTGIF